MTRHQLFEPVPISMARGKKVRRQWLDEMKEGANGPFVRSRSVAILAQEPFLVRTCTVFFPITSASGFASSKCLQPSLVVSNLFSSHVRATEQMCQYHRFQPPLRILGSPNGSLPDLDGTGFRVNEILTQIEKLPLLIQSVSSAFPDSEWLSYDAKTTNVEQMVGSPCCQIGNECNVRLQWFWLRKLWELTWTLMDGSPATGSLGSHGPRSYNDNRNTRRRLDTLSNPEDEQSRSAVLLRFPCNTTKGLSGSIIFGTNPICQHITNLSEFIAKQVLCRSGSCVSFEVLQRVLSQANRPHV